jgi:hypothetical protein
LKAQPTLSSTRHHDHSNPNSRTMSPARFGGNLPMLGNQRNAPHLSSQLPPQSTDFPPLSSAPEKKTPVVGGAWTNSSSIKSVLRPGPSGKPHGPVTNNALVHYPTSGSESNMPMHFDDQEHAFDRPPPKSNAELYNPKGAQRRPLNGNNTGGPSGQVELLIDQMGDLKLEQKQGESDGALVGASALPSES